MPAAEQRVEQLAVRLDAEVRVGNAHALRFGDALPAAARRLTHQRTGHIQPHQPQPMAVDHLENRAVEREVEPPLRAPLASLNKLRLAEPIERPEVERVLLRAVEHLHADNHTASRLHEGFDHLRLELVVLGVVVLLANQNEGRRLQQARHLVQAHDAAAVRVDYLVGAHGQQVLTARVANRQVVYTLLLWAHRQ
jgi:hypothetical protein